MRTQRRQLKTLGLSASRETTVIPFPPPRLPAAESCDEFFTVLSFIVALFSVQVAIMESAEVKEFCGFLETAS